MSIMAQQAFESSRGDEGHPSPVAPAPAKDGAPHPTARAPAVRSLDDLALMGPDELAALYQAATTPALMDLDGDLVGRMLAVPALHAWLGGLFRRFAAWAHFPWRGKSFKSQDPAHGQGINRVFGDRNPRRWFRFDTSIAPSRAGAFDAFQLDYDNPGNPALIRAIKDEVRQVAPGLFLGLAYLMWRKRPRLVLYFGLARR